MKQNPDYLWRKFQTCKALIAEKEATIQRLQWELAGLHERKLRLGKNWKEAKKARELIIEDANTTDA